MTDRELLELAAKAAGIVVIRSRLDDPLARDMLVANGHRNPHHETGPWNPLTDDGDALRLAVGLRMHVMVYADECHAVVWGDGTASDREATETNNRDPVAATRRAIVRAAAEIGRNKND